MKKNFLIICFSLLMLAGCGNGNELKGIYEVGVNDKNNIEYKLTFEEDNIVTVEEIGLMVVEKGSYELFEKDSMTILKFKNFDRIGDFTESDGLIFDKDKMTLEEGEYKLTTDNPEITEDTPFKKIENTDILFLKKVK
ncbi:hypothetical protein [Macrococcus armenti]|uniref:hypothetical protein n=1 Tax=Macrococcus armenti TaxID=2875764 RepID=UPI001CCF65C8|nr:hypothetical protein [Macrococcus armenti]UBH16606.1 hypothetical protein LAU44_11890 [Macrococcus armenti]UBH21240.1 hypothetical protein LAU40_11925 [Macrococcus armenti]